MPDMFYYNFDGYTGKFVFDKNQQVYLIPHNNLDIEFTLEDDGDGTENPNIPDRIVKFTIKTDKGKKYTFEEYELSRNSSYTEQLNLYPTTAWYLTKIEDLATKETIVFSYEEIPVISYGASRTEVYQSLNMGPCVCAPYSENTITPKIHKMAIDEAKILKSIESKYGKVVFSHKDRIDLTGDKAITGFKVYSYNSMESIVDECLETEECYSNCYDECMMTNGNANECDTFCQTNCLTSPFEDCIEETLNSKHFVKEFVFEQSYFESPLSPGNLSTNADETWPYYKRLKLDRIWEKDKNGNTLPPHIFNYNYEKGVTFLPHRLSYEQDVWGYYNANGATTLLPKLWFYPDDTDREAYSPFPRHPSIAGNGYELNFPKDADRQSEFEATKACILESVSYPTGGGTVFDYEINRFNYKGEIYEGAGLRVSKKTTTGGAGGDAIVEYEYLNEENGVTSGHLSSMPQFAYACLKLINPIIGIGSNYFAPTVAGNTFLMSKSQANLGMSGVSTVGYSRVVEKLQNSGQTIYKFTSPAEYPDLKPELYYNNASSGYGFDADCYDEYESLATEFAYDYYPFGGLISQGHKRGLITHVEDKTESGNSIRVITKSYEFEPVSSLTYNLEQFFSHNHIWSSFFRGSTTTIYSDFVYVEEETETLDGALVTTTQSI